MIGGEDTVLIVAADRPGMFVSEFLRRWLVRWPSMLVAAGDSDQAAFVPWATQVSALPDFKGEVLVARDRKMELEWEERGYFAEEDGEGPVGLFYEPRPAGVMRATALDDPYNRQAFVFETHEVLIVGQGLALITVVTGAPEFARRLISALGEQS